MQKYCRVSRELDAVKQEASLLRDQMTMVKHDIEKVSFTLKTRKKTLFTVGLCTKMLVVNRGHYNIYELFLKFPDLKWGDGLRQ